ncbi:MAG: glycoside hydrolase family 31 protein [Propioniciclava sp.]|uniref:glycoside hydrolase family 31 protein n=1 Tax=Propioniciclava sp. TaxID=2038686 RepID=UPI0039E2F938
MVTSDTVNVEIEHGEWWWGGAAADGTLMPFGRETSHHRDLARNAGLVNDPADASNQSAPVLISSHGRVIASDQPFTFTIEDGQLRAEGTGVQTATADVATLRGAYREAVRRFMPASGRTPAPELFEGPQYNTWIELPYTPTQQGVLDYARRILAAGFPPGVLMIDDLWAADYGDWRFEAGRFPDPRAMVDELHRLGFRVMVWVVPFISPDNAVYRALERRDLLLRGADGEIVVRRWWNGWSAVLDLTFAPACDWWADTLRALQAETGVDGFKFDAGDLRDYRDDDQGRGGIGRIAQTAAYARFGEQFAFNEFRASWRAGGLGLAQRLHDKPPTWDAAGLGSLIPEGIAQSLTGHAFNCPDMIGGGDLAQFEPGAAVDVEQFVRYAQCAALFPMMQFSLNPARVLDEEALAAVKAAVALRQALVPEILALVAHAARTGEPILRPLAYHDPGTEQVTDQFLLGKDVLVAPVLERGATHRQVVLPHGRWAPLGTGMPDGQVVEVTGDPVTLTLDVTLASLPAWRRIHG